MLRVLVAAAVVGAAALLAAGAAARAASPPPLTVGATDRFLVEPTLTGSLHEAKRLQRAGMSAVRLVVLWTRGETAPPQPELVALENAAQAAQQEGLTLYLSVYPSDASQVPRDDAERAVFAAFAAGLATDMPSVRNVIVGNEPNHNRYWLPQFGPNGEDVAAPAFEQMLAAAYDALKAVSPQIMVWGCGCAQAGSDTAKGRQTHSPVRFLEDVGAALRASGRTRPIMDGLAYHPYMPSFDTPPTFRYLPTSTTITVANYPHLVGVLERAFYDTPQPAATLPIIYDEFGVQATVPDSKQALYTGTTPPRVRHVDPATQARFYTAALQLAACQPNVRALLVYPFEDEPNRARWQSGLYYLDGTPRPSLAAVRQDAAEIEAGTFVRCDFLRRTRFATVLYDPVATDPSATITSDRPATYRLRVVQVGGGVTAEATGALPRATMQTVALHVHLGPGRYRFTLTLRPASAPVEQMQTAVFSVS